jgi:DNA-binding protein H-NS
MARKSSLASMSIDALLKLRGDVGNMLSRKADQLKKELASLGADYAEVGRIAIYGKKKTRKTKGNGHALKGRKIAPKYRSKKDPKLAWSGRGATPVWMREEMKGTKLKKENFLIKS